MVLTIQQWVKEYTLIGRAFQPSLQPCKQYAYCTQQNIFIFYAAYQPLNAFLKYKTST